MPLAIGRAVGLSAIETGVTVDAAVRHVAALAAAAVPKLFPDASPRRVVRLGFVALLTGIIILIALLDVGAGPEIVT